LLWLKHNITYSYNESLLFLNTNQGKLLRKTIKSNFLILSMLNISVCNWVTFTADYLDNKCFDLPQICWRQPIWALYTSSRRSLLINHHHHSSCTYPVQNKVQLGITLSSQYLDNAWGTLTSRTHKKLSIEETKLCKFTCSSHRWTFKNI